MLSQFKALLIMCAAALFGMAAPAQAQTGFPDILEDIFKGGQNQAPFGTNPGGVYIENIPVQVTFDTRPDLLPSEATLIVTAIAPPPPNVRRASPLVMGETRLLISRLVPPLNLVVAVPSDMARDLDYANISARIVDANGNIVQQTRQPEEYSGGQPPFLSLVPAGSDVTPQTPAPQTQGQAPFIPANVIAISGKVSLIKQRPLMRGSTLVVRVTENGLAGGSGQDVVTEERIDIDGKQAPLTYEVFAPTGFDNALESPEIEIWIEDWAGRKTHVTRAPIPFTPSDVQGGTKVDVRLDTLLTGADAVPPNTSYIAPAGVMRDISGEAKFNAFKGLPRGATLTVTLQDGTRLDEIIADVKIPLDGLSGNIPFNMQIERQRLEGRRSDPLLSAKINDSRGRTLLLSRTLVTLQDGFMAIDLQPTAIY